MVRSTNVVAAFVVCLAAAILPSVGLQADGGAAPPPEPVRSETLGEWARALHAPGGARRRAVDTIAGVRLYVVNPTRGGETLPKAVADLFGYKWIDGAGERVLTQSKERGALADRLRQEAARRGSAELRARITALRNAAQRLAGDQASPTQQVPPLSGLLAQLSEQAVSDLLRDRVWVSERIHGSDTPLAAAVRKAFPSHSFERGYDRNGRLTSERTFSRYDAENGNFHLLLDVYGTADLQGVNGGVANLVDAAPPPAPRGSNLPVSRGDLRPNRIVLPAPPPGTGGPEDRSDPRLRRTIRLSIPEGTGPLAYPDVLQRVADAAGLTIVSDAYTSTRFSWIDPASISRPAPLDELLDRISAWFSYTWRLEGDTLLLRHARWYFEELGEIPDPVLLTAAAAAARQGELTLADLSELASRLDREQFQNLPAFFPNLLSIRYRHHSLRLFASLTEEQRRAAAGEGLPFTALNPGQQRLFLEVTRSERPLCMLVPAPERSRWRLLIRRGGTEAAWVVAYQWEGNDLQGTALPPAVRIDPADTLRPTVRAEHPADARTV